MYLHEFRKGQSLRLKQYLSAGSVAAWRFRNECADHFSGFGPGTEFEIDDVLFDGVWKVKMMIPGSYPPRHLVATPFECNKYFERCDA